MIANRKRPRPGSMMALRMFAYKVLFFACAVLEVQRGQNYRSIAEALFVPYHPVQTRGRPGKCQTEGWIFSPTGFRSNLLLSKVAFSTSSISENIFPSDSSIINTKAKGEGSVSSRKTSQKGKIKGLDSVSTQQKTLKQPKNSFQKGSAKGEYSAAKRETSYQTKKRKSNMNSFQKGNNVYKKIQRKNFTPKLSSNSTTPATSNDPWKADYATSVRTQKKIQSAAAQPKGSSDYVSVARDVLQTLLDTPPAECNPANIVCALTLSAKVMDKKGSSPRAKKAGRIQPPLSNKSRSFQESLMDTIDILQSLVHDQRLSARQLCNAAWAIAKHVNHDESLFSTKKDHFIFVKDGSKSYSTWDLTQQQMDDESTDKRIDEVFNLIALRMIEHLQQSRTRYGKEIVAKRVQPGELSMLIWAYAVAKPRDCPPGWEQPRRIEKLSEKGANSRGGKLGRNSNGKDSDVDLVTFVELSEGSASRAESSAGSGAETSSQHRSITSRLFDATAIAFCQGEGAAIKESKKDGMTMLRSCTWLELSNIAWSFASRGAYGTKESEAMMTFLAKEATRRIILSTESKSLSSAKESTILPRDVTQIAWALGTMESDNASIGDALVYLVDAANDYWIENSHKKDRPLKYWRCLDLVQMATALAHGRLDNRSLLTAIYEESTDRLIDRSRGFTTPEISILMWVQARLYLTPKISDVFGSFPSAASRAILQRMDGRTNNDDPDKRLLSAHTMRYKGLRSQEQANLAWSLTVLEQYDEGVTALLQNIFHAASSDADGMIQLEHAHQLWQSYFLLSKDCPDAVKFVSAEFSQYLERKWNDEKSRLKQSSSRHKAISQTLDLMRVAHRNEHDEDIDVAIVLDEDSEWTHTAQSDFDAVEGRRKVAVEFDGPYHFTVMASSGKDLTAIENGAKITPRVLGHTVLKYRLLKRKGWAVVRIPYYEFDKIPYWASMVSYLFWRNKL